MPGPDARTDPFCDHLGGHCHLPSVSSHLHLHFLLPARPADWPQHNPQEPVHQPLHRWAALPHRHWQDRIPREFVPKQICLIKFFHFFLMNCLFSWKLKKISQLFCRVKWHPCMYVLQFLIYASFKNQPTCLYPKWKWVTRSRWLLFILT